MYPIRSKYWSTYRHKGWRVDAHAFTYFDNTRSLCHVIKYMYVCVVDHYHAMKFECILRKLAYHTLEQRSPLYVRRSEREARYKLINMCKQWWQRKKEDKKYYKTPCLSLPLHFCYRWGRRREEGRERERGAKIFLFFSHGTKERVFCSVSISISRTVREYIKRMWGRFVRLHHKHW